MIQPRNDLILIERIDPPQSGAIFIPDIAKEKSILGKVLAVGPGKRAQGEWHKIGVSWSPDADGIQIASGGEWEWVADERTEPFYRPGDIVYFNSKWSEFSGSHYSEDQLRDRNLHLVMQADIFLKVANGNRPN